MTQPCPSQVSHIALSIRASSASATRCCRTPAAGRRPALCARAAELNCRPIALAETYHAGTLPQRNSYLAAEPENIVVSAVKRAEDGDDLIVRCYETSGVATRATIRLPKWNRTIEAAFGPSQIKTFRVPLDAAQPVVETNMIEW